MPAIQRWHTGKRRFQANGIAAVVGYNDASFFRRLFKRLVGVTPGTYRRMFRREPLVKGAGPASRRA